MINSFENRKFIMNTNQSQSNENNKPQLEQFTFGKSPACVYLVALINQGNIKKYRKLHTRHQELNAILNELLDAYQTQSISLKTFLHLLNIKKKEVRDNIDTLKELMLSKAVTIEEKNKTTTLLNVYENVMMMEFKKLQRETQFYHIAKIKSEQQARSLARNNNSPNVGTYEVQGHAQELPYQATVTLSTSHAPIIIVKTTFVDTVNDEVLFKRHNARMQRRNKQY